MRIIIFMLYVLISGVFSYAQNYINQEIVQNNG